jgi:hypothetical protein
MGTGNGERGPTGPAPHLLGPDAPTQDFVGLAFGALGFSVMLGTGLAAVVVFAVRSLQRSAAPTPAVALGSAPAVALLGGTLVALVAAALATWRLLAPIRSPYRQGMLAMVAAFATLPASLVLLPIDRAFGRAGLAGTALLALAIAAALGRRLTRGRRS